MNTLEKTEAQKFAKVLRASRKMKGVGQQELASTLGVSQSLLSKMENGIIIPSAPVWFYICKFLEIQSDSGIKGYIDRRKESEVSNTNRLGSFRIPEKYSYLQGSMTRTSRPFLLYFAQRVGEKKTNEFIKGKKIDPDYFVILDVPLNINFNLDILRTLIASGNLKKKDIPEIASLMKTSFMHGELSSDYENEKDPRELLKALERNILKYDGNWKYSFNLNKKDRFEIECVPQPHLK